MITLPELLEDKIYKKFFLELPEMPSHYTGEQWRVYILLHGKWRWKEVKTYRKALTVIDYFRPEMKDGAIHSKALSFRPPERLVKITRGGTPVMKRGSDGVLRPAMKLVVWKPKLPPLEDKHLWCSYCRRPTIFKLFTRHHAFPKTGSNILRDERCTICGMTRALAGR